MPFFDYRCQACGHAFEAMQKINDAPLVTCPACQADTLQKQLSAPVFRLKGGGWYETDFKSDNKRNLHDGSKEEKPKSDAAGAEASKSKAKPTQAKTSESAPKANAAD
jgi:putative FmdB family regulatory protein